MSDKVYHVLFLSRRNSARSILAEAVMNKNGRGRFKAYSAAIAPAPAIDPHVTQLLTSFDLPSKNVRPKSVEEFTRPGAPALDFVFTLSDTVAKEPLPHWPGGPVTAHWSMSDPILVEGEEWEKSQAFRQVLAGLERRLNIFMSLPLASLDPMSLRHRLDEIGQTTNSVDA